MSPGPDVFLHYGTVAIVSAAGDGGSAYCQFPPKLIFVSLFAVGQP
jgi:hypothetical protein